MSKIFNGLEKYKEKIALVDIDNKEYSYDEILRKVQKISHKVQKGTLILFLSSNILESVTGYISFIRNNNILILLDKSFEKKFVEKMINNYQPSFIYKPKNYFLKNYINKSLYNGDQYELLRTNFKLKKNFNKNNFLLLTTSVSTQNPKLVRLSEEKVLNKLKE